MKLHVSHVTRYDYSLPVSQSVNQLCLLPASGPHQTRLRYRVDVVPEPETMDIGTDPWGNTVARFGIVEPHTTSRVSVSTLVDTRDETPPLPPSLGIEESLERLRTRGGVEGLMAHDCLLPSPWVPPERLIDNLLAECPPAGRSVLEHAEALMRHIHATFEYDPKFSTLVTPIAAVLDARRGVCQDFAHLAICALRRAGVPARYVSGYLETLPPPGKKKLRGADASHAWFAVYDAASGWHDFDPTNDKRPDHQYVVTAWGRDYGDVTPLKGIVFGGGRHTLKVQVDVDRVTTPSGLPPYYPSDDPAADDTPGAAQGAPPPS